MRIISLFSGAGGFDLGMIQAGHEVVWANDIDPNAVETYKKNIGNHIVCEDITKVKFDNLPSADMVIGGFPCQGFSIANMNRRKDDPRNLLYREYLRALQEIKPKYFIAENVRGILSLEKGKVFDKILKEFGSEGYNVQHILVNAANYGVPQNRYRVFILGIRKDITFFPEFYLEPTHGKERKPFITIGEVLKDIPEPEEKHNLKNHVYSKYKIKNNGYIGHRIVNADKPAPTVTARGDAKGGAMINHHPGNHRRLSVRETAIIQSFPLEFEFCGSMTSCYTQIGNAVPPKLAFALGEFMNDIERQDSKSSRQL